MDLQIKSYFHDYSWPHFHAYSSFRVYLIEKKNSDSGDDQTIEWMVRPIGSVFVMSLNLCSHSSCSVKNPQFWECNDHIFIEPPRNHILTSLFPARIRITGLSEENSTTSIWIPNKSEYYHTISQP
jgi:hypothetical protein